MNLNIKEQEELLKSLSEEERELALQILKEYGEEGTSKTYDDLLYADFEEIPVDIHTFLHDRRYLGNALYDSDGRFTLFPFWEDTLKKIFPTNTETAYNTLILTGAIGIGKSTIAVLCQLYLLYRLLCLKDPYLYYGMQPIDKISISLMNITLENAKGVAYDKLMQMILTSEWFLQHGEVRGTTNLTYEPNKHIELITASSNNQVIGRALFCNFSDEVNWSTVRDPIKVKEKYMKLISQIDARMKSRFMRQRGDSTYLPTLNIIASSKDIEQAFLESYINLKKKNESKTTLIIDEPQWVVDSRKDSEIKFYVAIGNKFLANELIPLNATKQEIDLYRARGYSILPVPIGYLENFRDNLDEAICSIAGISTASTMKYISGARWNDAKIEEYENPFTKELIEVGTAKEDTSQYSDYFDMSKVSDEMLSKPLFVHLDMSKSGDATGICGVYIKEKKPKVEGEDSSKEMFYKVAFSVSVKAPRGYEISFDKNRQFIRWLREQGFNVKGISCFKGNTLIKTPLGNKFISELKEGDLIYAYDEESGKVVESFVEVAVNNGPKKDFVKLWLDEDTFIECTPDHKIMTSKGYKEAIEINENDEIIVDDRTYLKYRLLSSQLFEENDYLDAYIDLVTKCLGRTKLDNVYYERHHIFPRGASKKLNRSIDNSKKNIVLFTYKEHINAHWLLSKCATGAYLYEALSSVTRMLGKENLSEEEYLDFINDIDLQNKIEETKRNFSYYMSNKMKGNSFTKGRKHTDEEKLKLSISNKKPHNCHPHSEFKKGMTPWNKGRKYDLSAEEKKELYTKKVKQYWYTNGCENKLITEGYPVPEGFYRGRHVSEEVKKKISETNKKLGIKPKRKTGIFEWYTDGTRNIQIYKNDIVPEGFYKGRALSEEVLQKIRENAKNIEHNGMKGKHHSQETKNKISASLKNRKKETNNEV